MGIRSIGTAIRIKESIDIDILAARLGVRKHRVVRGIIRYALKDGEKLFEWLEANKDEWVGYGEDL